MPLGSAFNERTAPIRGAIEFNPVIPLTDDDGNPSLHDIISFLPNPVSLLNITDETLTERILANAFVDINILEGLDGRIKVGMDRRAGNRNSYLPTSTIFGNNAGGEGDKTLNRKNDLLFGATLTYQKSIKDHSFTALAGYEYQEFNDDGFDATNNRFITDGFLYNNLGAGVGNRRVESYKLFSELASYFGRVNYSFKDTYLATITLRRDGSPNFGENNKYGNFPSASIAWRIVNEDFMSGIGVISDLKLRVGYGQTGNTGFGIATSLFQDGANFVTGTQGNEQERFGVRQTRLANPDLKWQTNTEINVGLDFGLFDGRINGTFEYFDKEVSDLLNTRQLRTYLPISRIADNIGVTSSKGVELTLASRNLIGALTWTTEINLGTYRDRWEERHPDDILPVYLKEKDFIRPNYFYVIDGIQQTEDPIPVHQPNIDPGQVRVKDLNGVDTEGNLTGTPDGRITDADRVLYGSQDPGYTYGIYNRLGYKGFEFSFFFQGMADRHRFNRTRLFFVSRADKVQLEGRNTLTEFLDRWTPENSNSNVPSGRVNSTPGADDPLYLEKADFLRLRNVALRYTLPAGTLGNSVSGASIFFEAQNLFIITDYTGIDPEFDDVGAYPNQRSYTLGVSMTF